VLTREPAGNGSGALESLRVIECGGVTEERSISLSHRTRRMLAISFRALCDL